MIVVDALAACSRAVDRAICAAIEHGQRQEALERRRVLEGPGASRRPDRIEWRWRWAVWRNRLARLRDRLLGRR